jgi:hypothetical protein
MAMAHVLAPEPHNRGSTPYNSCRPIRDLPCFTRLATHFLAPDKVWMRDMDGGRYLFWHYSKTWI